MDSNAHNKGISILSIKRLCIYGHQIFKRYFIRNNETTTVHPALNDFLFKILQGPARPIILLRGGPNARLNYKTAEIH